jgi:hypothetical protein
MGLVVFGRRERKGLSGFEEFRWRGNEGQNEKRDGKRFVSLVDGLSLIHHNEERCVDCLTVKEIFIFSNFVLFLFSFSLSIFRMTDFLLIVQSCHMHSTSGRIYYMNTRKLQATV